MYVIYSLPYFFSFQVRYCSCSIDIWSKSWPFSLDRWLFHNYPLDSTILVILYVFIKHPLIWRGDFSSTWRVTWGYHGVIAWVTQANTTVEQIYYFLIFNIKSIYVLYFHTYMYYKRILVVSNFALAKRWLKKIFKPARNSFKYIYPQNVFRHSMFLWCLSYWFYTHFTGFPITFFLTFRYFRLVSFTIILFIHWVHALLTSSFPLFQVRYHSYSSDIWWAS